MPSTEESPQVLLQWNAWPARQNPAQAMLACLVIVALGVAVGFLAGDWFWGALAVLVLAVSLNRYLLPSSYTIDEKGISVSHPIRRQRMEFDQAKRFLTSSTGGFLSTRTRASRLDSMIGIELLFGDHRQEAIEILRDRVSPSAQVQAEGVIAP
ncbi:MAG: hypothetical protein CMJ32_06350 [Phycisphaerae bacterium]|nr:hypothetical protein [Phycisphaerae bacterium]